MTKETADRLWKIFSGPLMLLGYGLAIFLVFFALKMTGLFTEIAGFLSFPDNKSRIATLVFLVGLSFAAFLWWLCARSFALIRSMSSTDAANAFANLKDTPMALPEGTVRAVIALIVGVVGLPLLMYTDVLNLSDAVAGYVNGIIIGVFSYYFGSRSSSADAQTTRQTVKLLGESEEGKRKLETQVNTLGGAVVQAQSALLTTETRNKLRDDLQRLKEHVSATEVLIETLGPVLPKGLVPDGAAEALHKARLALGAVQGLETDGFTADTVKQVSDATEGLFGKSPVVELLKSAATVMPVISGLTPVTAVALALGTAWQLGSDQYRRWVARVLNAPYDPQIISHGQISATSAAIALEQSPIFNKAFSVERQQPAFVSDLLTQVLSDDGADHLWAKYGNDTNRFASRGELENGLLEFRSVLLWEQSSQDITPEQIQNALAPLTGTAFAPTAIPSLDNVNEVLKQMGKPGAADEPHIAMEALILWVGYMRQINLDPVYLLARIWRS
ncbi:hypothetical protein EJA72_15890 [Pseudomonas sp. PB120]|uniref:hypothetical protein n=1 Tax=Pseudomonas sp. PB120 TaxID=2494700 RepID=UPI0012FD9555|nr:hypothetical protein [Pseudomonas sp. PB120]MVV49706.1 hypothetical protein [Pseudomonas sp. PB120]